MAFSQYPCQYRSIVDLFENKHTNHQDKKLPYKRQD